MECDHSANPSGCNPLVKSDLCTVGSYGNHFLRCGVTVFNGTDPEEWLASVNDFFEFYDTKDHIEQPWHPLEWKKLPINGSVGFNNNVNWQVGTIWSEGFDDSSQ
ncbi:hypothetical protein PVK06_008810 [Gossypium arboreum]|uniref:Uncharacterized protein n=1 Tax=Gossypium arboreum TaxID=29729 RepID=A0ABR0QKV8_GOSAR|nr:hypothetical protein PVK06_008810 [Gossypium arboreum]